MTTRTAPKLLTSTETAEMLGIMPNTLEIWRTKGKGPRFLKMGPQKQAPVRYAEADVMVWINERTCSNTSQYMNLPQLA